MSRKLNPKKFQILVVSPRSYFVFTPLLNSTAVGTLEFRTALEPVRDRRSQVHFFQAWADDVDFANKTARVEESVVNPLVTKAIVGNSNANVSKGEEETALRMKRTRQEGKMFELKYDTLVVAVGCYSQTFGTKGVKEHALFMKDVGDARKVRKRVLECFEIAELPITTDAMRKHLLHFAIVGGGPTGMEFAAELSDLIHEDLVKLYPGLEKFIKISVYDVAPKVLSMFDESLANYAMEVFKREGVELKTSHHVEELRPGLPAQDVGIMNVPDTEGCYTLKTKEEGEVGVAMCVWSTGNMMNPFVQNAVKKCHAYPEVSAMMIGGKSMEEPDGVEWMIKKNEKTGAIVVDDHLRIQLETRHAEGEQPEAKAVMKDVFALGDNAALENIVLPATAQTANQQALWLGKHLNKGDIDTQTFSFKNMGMMTYLGNAKGLVQTPGDRISGVKGRTAWLIWRGAYLTLSVSWKNRILIPIYWYVIQ